VRFDLSPIPQAAQIVSADLQLHCYQDDLPLTRGVATVHRIAADWAEDTVTWYQPWSSQGGDFGPAVSSAAVLSVDASGTWLQFDVTKAAAALMDGAANHGVMLVFSGTDYLHLRSSEYVEVQYRPRLVVDYDTDTDDDGISNDADDDDDNDGLTDAEEANHGTDRFKPDTDSDGYTDRDEVDRGTDPLNPRDYPGAPGEGLCGRTGASPAGGLLAGLLALVFLVARSCRSAVRCRT